MRHFAILFTALTLTWTSIASTEENSLTIPQDAAKKPPSTAPDESEVKYAVQELMDAFNHHDPDKIGSLWSKEGVLYHPLTGITSRGSEEIRNYYKEHFTTNGDSTVDIVVNDVQFNGADEAIVKGFFKLTFKDKPPEQSVFRANLIREGGKWVFNEFTDIELEPAPSQYDHLKELGWLIGEWIDEDENIEITSDFKWDKNKNFIYQHFISKVLDQEQIEGWQIIGWDPTKEEIRSWVFDSDGGFGNGYWNKKTDNSWNVKLVYTVPDGRKGSSTLIYKKIDDNSYQFAAVERDIDGEILPDINPVVVHKKQ